MVRDLLAPTIGFFLLTTLSVMHGSIVVVNSGAEEGSAAGWEAVKNIISQVTDDNIPAPDQLSINNDSAFVASGEYSFKLVDGATDSVVGLRHDARFLILNDGVYTLSFDALFMGNIDPWVSIKMFPSSTGSTFWAGGGYALSSSSFVSSAGANGFTHYEMTLPAIPFSPGTPVIESMHYSVTIFTDSYDNRAGTLYIDNVSIVPESGTLNLIGVVVAIGLLRLFGLRCRTSC